MPEAIDNLVRRIRQLEIEKVAVSRDRDDASRARLARIDEEIAELKAEERTLRGQWETERTVIQKIRALKEQIEQLHGEEQKAEREGNLARVAEIRYGQIRELQSQLEKAHQQLSRYRLKAGC